MASHTAIVDSLSKTTVVNLSMVEHQIFLCRVLLHAADLSSSSRQFHIAKKWSTFITDEFNSQVQMERKLKLPVINTWMECLDVVTTTKNEIHFIRSCVRPLFLTLARLYPSLDHLLVQIDSNIVDYERILEICSAPDPGGSEGGPSFR